MRLLDSMKAFFYKTLTTVIDDFGSMIIPMPWREFDHSPTMISMLTERFGMTGSSSPIGLLP